MKTILNILFFTLYLMFVNSIICKGQTTIKIEAENADTIFHGTIDYDHPGFSGSGFVNQTNEIGSYIVWNIYLPGQNTYECTIRYANGSTDRTMDIYLNGGLIQSDFNFISTGEWTNWDSARLFIMTFDGLNTLKFVSSNPSGGPNLDLLILYNPDITIDFEPVAQNDSVTISVNQTAYIDVLRNDYDYNMDSLWVESFSTSGYGTVSKTDENIIKYKPDRGFIGKDKFEYTITEGVYVKTAKVIINVREIDWSVEFADMILNTRTPATVGPWNYITGLLLEGMLRVYNRTSDIRYLNFVTDWADLHISATGEIDAELYSLDNMMPGFMILHLYDITKNEKYKVAAIKIRKRFDTYPRTTDSAFWHSIYQDGELWLDGLYMSMPFLATYGKMFEDEDFCYTEVIRGFKIYTRHLKNNSSGLLLHAYDEDGSSGWALPPENRSPHHWGRSIGWVMMGLMEVIEIIPPDFPQRDTLIDIYTSVLEDLANYQDSEYGLWYQVINVPDDSRNWHETSCTMMYILSMKRAVQNGLLDASHIENVELGYSGVLSKVFYNSYDIIQLTDICEGTGVSDDIQYYFDRRRYPNDNHGLGIFLIMNELIIYNNLH